MTGTIILSSDIHGSLPALNQLLERAKEHQAPTLLIAGDLCPSEDPAFVSLLHSGPHVVLVRGNCDNGYAFNQAKLPLPPLSRSIPYNDCTLLLTHGDRFPSPYGFSLKRGDMFVFGHTHHPKVQRDKDGILLINPGSTTFPRTPLGPTYAVLDHEGVSIRSLDDGKPLTGYQYLFTFDKDQ